MDGSSITDTVGEWLGVWSQVEQAKLNARLAYSQGQIAALNQVSVSSNSQAKTQSYAVAGVDLGNPAVWAVGLLLVGVAVWVWKG